jgi:hypothetical protein
MSNEHSPSEYRQYLGDSVYIRTLPTGELVIYTENGFGPTNEIFLEPDVYLLLAQYINNAVRLSRVTREAEGRS